MYTGKNIVYTRLGRLLNKSFKSWQVDFRAGHFILDNESLTKFGALAMLVSIIFFTSLIKSLGFHLEISLCEILCQMCLYFLGKTSTNILVPTLTCVSSVLGSSPILSLSP